MGYHDRFGISLESQIDYASELKAKKKRYSHIRSRIRTRGGSLITTDDIKIGFEFETLVYLADIKHQLAVMNQFKHSLEGVGHVLACNYYLSEILQSDHFTIDGEADKWLITKDESVLLGHNNMYYRSLHNHQHVKLSSRKIIANIEIVSPVMSYSDISSKLNMLDISNTFVNNQSTSNHVHLSFSEFITPYNLYKICIAWFIFEPLIMAMVTPDRRDNMYCVGMRSILSDYKSIVLDKLYKLQKLQFRTIDDIIEFFQIRDMESSSQLRYVALNLLNLRDIHKKTAQKLNTIEVRLKHGSADMFENDCWIKFLSHFFMSCINNPPITEILNDDIYDVLYNLKPDDGKDKLKIVFDFMFSFIADCPTDVVNTCWDDIVLIAKMSNVKLNDCISDEQKTINSKLMTILLHLKYDKELSKDEEHFLLKHRNNVTSNGSLLHIALKRRAMQAIPKLLQFGVDVNIQDASGHTMLFMLPCESLYNILKIVQRLGVKTDMNIQTHMGNTLLHTLLQQNCNQNLVDLIIEMGARTNIYNKDWLTAKDIAIAQKRRVPSMSSSKSD